VYDPGQLYVDPILSNFSLGFQDQDLYGLRLAPETPVNTQSGRYRVFDRSDWLRYSDARREPGTVAGEISGRKWSQDEFFTEERSLSSPIYDEELQQLNSLGGLANPAFGGALTIDPAVDAATNVMRSLQLDHEVTTASIFNDTTNYPTNHVVTLAGSTQWSDYTGGTSSTSDPVSNLKLAFMRVKSDTGRWPNTMVIPFDGVGVIENHPRIVARFQFFALTNPSAWQVLLGLPPEATAGLNIFIVDSKINSADNVDAAEDITYIWGENAWVGLVDATPAVETMTFAKTFAQLYPNGGTRPTDRWREENRKADIVRTSWKWDVKVASGLAGYLFVDAFADFIQ
jgi:hypothetical protein